jgi:hypothetical protein
MGGVFGIGHVEALAPANVSNGVFPLPHLTVAFFYFEFIMLEKWDQGGSPRKGAKVFQ